MSTVADFYLDKGADFNAYIRIDGINNLPVCLEGWRFVCQTSLARNPSIKVNVNVDKDPSHKGVIVLRIPFCVTSKMPCGTWRYDVEMTYENVAVEKNKRLRVVSGKILVDDNITTMC